MEELLSNGWVVGIGGGILSGLIVAWLTSTLFSKKDLREIAINVSSANREILYAIRPEISESSLPTVQVIEALKNATARKYKIEPSRLHGITEVVEELIKEIMDSSFISSSAKKDYCESLKTLIPDKTIELEALSEDREVFVARVEYREKMTSLLSLTLGTIAALATMLSFLKSSFESSSLIGKVTGSVFPMILVMFSVVLVMTAMQVALKLRHRKIRVENGVPDRENSNKRVN
jgi:hypothetical protein